MGLFDLGASESSSSSQSTSNRDTFIAGSQLPFLQSLWDQTGSLAGQMSPQAVAMANQLGASLFPQGQGFANSLANLSQGRFGQGLQQTIAGLQSVTRGAVPGGALAGTAALQSLGSGALTDVLSQPNPGLQGSLDYLSANIQENLQSTLGTLSGQAALQGASSGGRQALSIGQAAVGANRDYAGQAAGLIGQDMTNRQALAPAVLQAQLGAASQLQQGDLAQRGQMLQANQQRLQGLLGASQAQLGAAGLQADAAQAGMAGLSGLFNLGMAPFSAAFGPLQQFASILGGPAILERMRAQSTSESEGSSASFGFGLPTLGGGGGGGGGGFMGIF